MARFGHRQNRTIAVEHQRGRLRLSALRCREDGVQEASGVLFGSSEGTARVKFAIRRGVVRESRQRVGAAIVGVIHVLFYLYFVQLNPLLKSFVIPKSVCTILSHHSTCLRVLRGKKRREDEPDGNLEHHDALLDLGREHLEKLPRPFATRSIKARLKKRNRTD